LNDRLLSGCQAKQQMEEVKIRLNSLL
jgi:hypothetical protein